MAELQGSSLINCLFIPDFIAAGSIMMFNGTSAPTSWTKLTTHNNKALRITNGTISSGGSTVFSSILTTRNIDVPSVTTVPVSITIDSTVPNLINVSAQASSPFNVSTQPGLADLVQHQHTAQRVSNNRPYIAGTNGRSGALTPSEQSGFATNSSGSSQNHPHGVAAAGAHSHTISAPGTHGHPSPASNHTHPVSPTSIGTQNFNVYYYDVILASKN